MCINMQWMNELKYAYLAIGEVEIGLMFNYCYHTTMHLYAFGLKLVQLTYSFWYSAFALKVIAMTSTF